MSAAAEAAPAAAEGGGKKSDLFTKVIMLPETLIKGTWNIGKKTVLGVSGYISQLVRGEISGAVQASLGTFLGGPIVDTAKSFSNAVKKAEENILATRLEIEQSPHIAKLGALIQGIVVTTGTAVANVVGWPLHVVGGAANRFTQGAAKMGSAIIGQYDKHWKKGAGAAPAAAGGGAHPEAAKPH